MTKRSKTEYEIELEKELNTLKKQLAKKDRRLGAEIKRLKEKNNKLRESNIALKKINKKLSQNKCVKTLNLGENIARSQYSEKMMELAVRLYSNAHCSLRGVVTVMETFKDVFGDILGKIPVYNTVENWVKRFGLGAYKGKVKDLKGKAYSLIIDESMQLGSVKMLLVVGVPTAHIGRPICMSDATILDMAVESTWNSQMISERVQIAIRKVGHLPEYVISDNASVMKKAVKISDLPRLSDISHSLGVFLEKSYKDDPEFKAFTAEMSSVIEKMNMKDVAHLLPPRQRPVSRFINLNHWVKWADKMLYVYHQLNPREQKCYSFIAKHSSFVKELSDVMQCIEFIETTMKNCGLCKSTVEECLKKLSLLANYSEERVRKLVDNISEFFAQELEIAQGSEQGKNNSSDIVESMFGMLKSRKSKNKKHGVTSFVLLLPAVTLISKTGTKACKELSFKSLMEATLHKDVTAWAEENLPPSPASKRRNAFKKCA